MRFVENQGVSDPFLNPSTKHVLAQSTEYTSMRTFAASCRLASYGDSRWQAAGGFDWDCLRTHQSTAGPGAHPAALAASVARTLPRAPYIGFHSAGFPAQVRPETVSGKDGRRRRHETVYIETVSGSSVWGCHSSSSLSQKRRFLRWVRIIAPMCAYDRALRQSILRFRIVGVRPVQ